jgi:hypothetical protein
MRTVQDVIERLRAEFVEMPDLRLSAEQVERLCGVEHTMCQSILDALVDAKFLCRKPDGTYARLTDQSTLGERASSEPRSSLPSTAGSGRIHSRI